MKTILDTSPLAAKMRPTTLADYIGQKHLLAPGRPLANAIEKGILHSMILWGPPGTGKTTLAHLLAANAHAEIEHLSAVLSGVKEIRAVLDLAEARQRMNQNATVLFVDEIHRFNKSQQDAFLPALESGLITLVGATTENPAFSLNNALLSRARVYVLKSLEIADLQQLLQRAMLQEHLQMAPDESATLVAAADGDARQLLNLLEMCGDLATDQIISSQIVQSVLGETIHRFDKGGDYFYDLISALHKSIRGSDPDAALYWMIRMLSSGCDPLYIARRLIRMASEDIGLADPRALEMTLNAWQVVERLGIPEGELALSQAVIYLAVAPKSNAVYLAHKHAEEDVKNNGSLDVPQHLRNKPIHYRYPHDEPHAYAAKVNYFPEKIKTTAPYYQPTERGLEKQIQDKLNFLKQLTF
jgi:putative ATPase